jgi:IS5 family transposase
MEYAERKRVSRREAFLETMNRLVPWQRLEGKIRPHYFAGKRGRPPKGIPLMLRMYLLQVWFNLATALRRAAFLIQALAGAIPDRALRLLKQSRRCGLTVAYAALRRVTIFIHTLARADTWRGLAADRQEGVAENARSAVGTARCDC